MFHPDGPSFLELMQQALASTERGYDLLAPKFDLTPFRTPDAILEVVGAHIGEVDRALDLCCGTGAAMRMLRPRCREELVGLDSSRGMMEEARRRLDDVPGPPVRFVRADVLDPPFDEAFDVVTCFGAFGHVLEKDEPRFVDAVRQVLRPGGRFVFVTAMPPPLWAPRRLLAHGFNLAMRIRNAVRKPEFVMYYLTFLVPRATALLEAAGFRVEVHADQPAPFGVLRTVVAHRGA